MTGVRQATSINIVEGAWLPIAIAAVLTLMMLTWVRGTAVLSATARKSELALDWLVRKLEAKPPHKVSGTAVFLTSTPNSAPSALLHNLKHNHMLHERNIIMSIKTADVPCAVNKDRINIEEVSKTFTKVEITYGFMETPSIPRALELCRRRDLNIDLGATSFFLSRRSLRRQHARQCHDGRRSRSSGLRVPLKMPANTFIFRPIASWRWESKSLFNSFAQPSTTSQPAALTPTPATGTLGRTLAAAPCRCQP